MRTALASLFFVLPTFALSGSPTRQEPAATPAVEQTVWHGVFVPSPQDAAPIEIWPESWAGEWLLLEVLPHGTWVHESQVIARFDARALTEALERTERDLASARLEHRIAVRRAELESASDQERLAGAVSALARAKEDFEAWRTVFMPLRREQMTLSELNSQHGIEDQEDELEQLEAMYGADELTDATEEIVLMRSRRNLAQSRTQLELARRQRAHTAEVEWVHEDQEKEEAMSRQISAVERLHASLELDELARKDRVQRSEVELGRMERDFTRLRQDATNLELRAPREGLLLHGAVGDYEPGHVPPRHVRGDRAATRRPVFTITSGSQYRVALEVGDTERGSLTPGQGVLVSSPGVLGFQRAGRLEVELFPLPRGGEEAKFAGIVSLEGELHGITPGMRAEVRLPPQ